MQSALMAYFCYRGLSIGITAGTMWRASLSSHQSPLWSLDWGDAKPNPVNFHGVCRSKVFPWFLTRSTHLSFKRFKCFSKSKKAIFVLNMCVFHDARGNIRFWWYFLSVNRGETIASVGHEALGNVHYQCPYALSDSSQASSLRWCGY